MRPCALENPDLVQHHCQTLQKKAAVQGYLSAMLQGFEHAWAVIGAGATAALNDKADEPPERALQPRMQGD